MVCQGCSSSHALQSEAWKAGACRRTASCQLILWLASAVSNDGRSSPLLVPLPPFLGPGFRLAARWNRLGETVKTRKKREKTGKKWARYGLKSVNKERTGGVTCCRGSFWMKCVKWSCEILICSQISRIKSD